MAIVKFDEKNVSTFAKIESTVGTYNAPAATDVLAVTSLEGSVTNVTDAFQYLGNVLSRDEYTVQKDKYAEFSAETFLQVIGSLDAGVAVTDVPMNQWFQACGGYITVFGTSYTAGAAISGTDTGVTTLLPALAAGSAIVNNGRVSNSSLSIDYRKNSSDDPTQDKLFKFTACRGMIDVNADIGTVSKIKYSMKGNAADPETVSTLVPDYGSQTVNVANVIRMSSIVSADIIPYGDVDVWNSTSKKAFCFSTLNAANFFGFDYARYQLGCEEGFAKKAIPTDVVVSMLEDKVGGDSFNPDANLSGFFSVKLKFGTADGKYITFIWTKLQLANVKESKIATYYGREVTFRNTGFSVIIFE
jgi:hypothetical protein